MIDIEPPKSSSRVVPTMWKAMIARLFDQQDESNPLNGSAISDGEQRSRILDSLRSRESFVAELFGEHGYKLLIGIG